MEKQFVHEPDASRYTLVIDGALASVLDYHVLGDSVSFSRAFTSPPFRGRGLAGELVAFAVDDVESTSHRRIVPTCWYVAEWFEAHPERASLLRTRVA